MKRLTLLVLSSTLLLLNACGSNDSVYHSYLDRLQNVLEIESIKIDFKSLTPPSKRQLKRVSATSKLNIKEFLSLRECKLHVTLAHRNSLIGKVASDSQLLLNDLEILANGPPCLQALKESPLKAKLKEFLALKEESILASLWNAIIAEEEYHNFWKNVDTYANYPQKLPAETIDDLLTLAHLTAAIKEKHYEITSNLGGNLEQHLGKIRFGDGGLLIAEYTQLSASMLAANDLIETAIAQPLCFNQKPNTKAKYLQNVVNKFFIDGVQRKSVLLEKRKEQLMTAVHALELSLIDQAPDVFLNWRKQRKIRLSAANEVTKHALLLQKLYAQCGLQVGTRPQ